MVEVQREHREGVAILTLDRPVANTLAPSLRSELSEALDHAARDDRVRAVVLHGAGAGFSTGIDLDELDASLQMPWISDLCLQIENFLKPVVVALHGVALGAGFELALAAHLRIALKGARVALPDITLGLIPGGGATQRLPRMAGAQVALELMLSGQILEVSDPRLKQIIDQVVVGEPLEAAVAAARDLANTGHWRRAQDRIDGFSDPVLFQKTIADVTDRLRNHDAAEADIVRCVEAAQLLPYARGLELERITFDERCKAEDARARRHFFTAERRARIMPERSSGRAKSVSEVVIPGRSTLVFELAIACLNAGLRVSLIGDDVAGTDALRNQIGSIYEHSVTRGALSTEAMDGLMARLTAAWPAEALARAGVVLDLGEIDLSLHHSMLSAAAIWVPVSAGGPMPLRAPQGIGDRHVDLRVYRPAQNTTLVELGVPEAASADAVVTVAQLFNRMGRIVVRCDCTEGLVGGNMSAALFAAALALAQAGASPYRIDAAARAMGFARGPFQLMDMEGLPDVATRLSQRKFESDVLSDRIASRADGCAAGKGFYLYDDKGTHPDLSIPKISGVASDWPIEQLGWALQAALVNEAARLMSVPVVQRASDIDVVMVAALGFERRRGGPLFQAEATGLFDVMMEMKRCSEISLSVWQPHQMIEDMVKNGSGFFAKRG